MAERIHQTSQVCNKLLVEYLLTGEALLTVEHRACAWRGRSDGRGIKKERYEAKLAREERSKKNRGILRLERAMVAGAWITVVPYLLNGATLSAEDFRDNLRIRFRLLPLYLHQTCNGCGDKLTVEHSL